MTAGEAADGRDGGVGKITQMAGCVCDFLIVGSFEQHLTTTMNVFVRDF